MTPEPDNRRAKKNVAVLIAAQAVIGSQLPMIFIMAGLIGQTLAPSRCLATLPVTMIVLGSMLTATPLSAIMQRYGRRAGFFVGAGGGLMGGIVGALGLWLGSFPVFLAGTFMTGIYQSSQGFFRYAATDTASESFRPRAISYTLAGGLAAAIIGPQLFKVTSEALVIPFLGTYLAVIVLNVVGSTVYVLLDIPHPPRHEAGVHSGRTRRELLATPEIAVAMIVAMVSYALMNLVMTSTPLAVVGCGFSTANAADVVSGHVLAMFVPSFFTGHLIARFGTRPIMAIGLVILAAAGAVALAGTDLNNFFAALILIGIGWNFGFIGATTMLTANHTPEERGRVQGLNDMLVFGSVTLASVTSGGLMNCSGGSPVEGWDMVNMAMTPFLVLAGGALIWLGLGRRRAA